MGGKTAGEGVTNSLALVAPVAEEQQQRCIAIKTVRSSLTNAVVLAEKAATRLGR